MVGLVALEYTGVVPGNPVFPELLVVCRRVGRVALDRRDSRAPACEGVGVLLRVRLRRCGVGRHDAVGHSVCVDGRAVVVLPRHRVVAQGRIVCRRVGRVALDRHDSRRPAREGVVVLRRRSLGRVRVGRHDAVGHGVCVDGRAILVEPCNRVGAQGRVVGCRVGRVALDRRNSRRPARERVGVLRRRRLGRRRAVVGGRLELLDQPFRKNRRAIVVNPRYGVLGDERAQARVQPLRELPHSLVPSLERHAALHLRCGSADFARAARGAESARLGVPAATAEFDEVILSSKAGDIAAADSDLANREAVGAGDHVSVTDEPAGVSVRRADSAERVAVGNLRATLVVADEAARVLVPRRDIARRIALRNDAAVCIAHETTRGTARRRHGPRRAAAAYRCAARTSKSARLPRSPCDSRRTGAIFHDSACYRSNETANVSVARGRHRTTHYMDVRQGRIGAIRGKCTGRAVAVGYARIHDAQIPDFRILHPRAEKATPVRNGHVADFVVVAVVVAPERSVAIAAEAQAGEVGDAGQVDVGSLHIVAAQLHRPQIRQACHRLAEHGPDGRLVVVALLWRQTLPADEHRASIGRRDELAIHIRRHAGAVAASADAERVLCEAVEDRRRVADGAAILAVADRVRVGLVVAVHLSRPVAVGYDDRSPHPLSEDAAGVVASLHGTGRIARFDREIRVVAVLAADESAAMTGPVRDGAEAAAAPQGQGGATISHIADDAARMAAACDNLQVCRAVLDEVCRAGGITGQAADA